MSQATNTNHPNIIAFIMPLSERLAAESCEHSNKNYALSPSLTSQVSHLPMTPFSYARLLSFLLFGFREVKSILCLNTKSSIFWDIMTCTPLKANRRFGGTYCLHL
jgi:hypothetical protein